MYEQFFGIQKKPFILIPDTEYFFRHTGHQAALYVLMTTITLLLRLL